MDRNKDLQGIINSFSLSYSHVFLLDNDGTYSVIKFGKRFLDNAGSLNGLHFIELAQKFADVAIYKPDRKMFVSECENDRIQSRLIEKNSYSVEFRVVNRNDGTRSWYEMVVRRLSENNFLLALRQHNKEIVRRLVDEKLYKEYASIFLVDLSTDTYSFIYRNPESGFRDVPGGCYSSTINEYASRVHPDFRKEWSRFADVEKVREILTKDSRIEYAYPLEGIEKRWRRCVLHLLDSEDGVPCTFIMTYITIDDTRAVEYELSAKVAKQKALLEEQQEQLQKALLDAQSANHAKTVFLNNMSHDIRTPLNAIIGFTNIAIKNIDTDKEKAIFDLEKVLTASRTLLNIVNDVLEISSIEAGKFVLEEQAGDVLSSFANIESMMSELACSAGLNLQFSYGEVEDRYVYMDNIHSTRVFTNIVSNAIKYTPAGGWIKVHCDQAGRRDDGYGLYRFVFEDNGIGMSQEFQKCLFDRFAREANSTVSKIQGTGLGLALCKDIVELMGGTIECRSEKGVGTCFTVILPFRIQEHPENSHPGHNAVRDTDAFKGKRVLLVEDNELNREISSAILEEMGLDVVCAEDGDIAVEMISKAKLGDYDLVFMDIQMPRLNGYDATRQIRALGTSESRIPIIAMTANAFVEDRIKAFEAGMNGHVGKPIDPKILYDTIATFLLSPTESQKNNCL